MLIVSSCQLLLELNTRDAAKLWRQGAAASADLLLASWLM
jgi:hypothetical protein